MSVLYAFFLLFCVQAFARPDMDKERITLFKSAITLQVDASILITEEISIWSKGVTIVHGIIRELPTHYQTPLGIAYHIVYKIAAILVDGKTAPYTLTPYENGIQIKIGDPDREVRGAHTYTVRYTTNRQLYYGNTTTTEFAWNVNGNGWRLPIDKIESIVQLPDTIPSDTIKGEAYTGHYGEKGTDYTYEKINNTLSFATTRPFKPGEGITIVTTFPHGYVAQPTFSTQLWWFITDNFALVWGIFCLLGLLIAMLRAWRKIRNTSRPGTIIPLFYPPEGISPSAIGYMHKKGFDPSLLGPDIIQLAVRGYISITRKKASFFGKEEYHLILQEPYSLISLHNNETVSAHDKQLLKSLFQFTQSTLILHSKNSTRIANTLKQIENACLEQCPSYVIDGNMLRLYIFGGTLLVYLIGLCPFIFLTHYEVPSLPLIMLGLFCLIPHLASIPLFKGYTREGRILQDKIDGFKLFLATTETERLKIVGTPPTKTPEMYETYLPYAIALEVEEQWRSQFSSLFAQLAEEKRPYHPIWYTGGHFYSGSQLTSHINSAISSSITPPGTKFRSGGSGSSGSGGGGGGGGGW